MLVDAGDVLQGTPYFNFYRGEVEYKAMSAIGYDVGTLGNHEFDNGVEALAAALKFANFDIVSANYDVKGTVLEGRVKPYVVKTVAGIRVGLFGLGISPVALITPANFKGITYIDPVVAAREVVKTLREKEALRARGLHVASRVLREWSNEAMRWWQRRLMASISLPAVTRICL